MLYLEGGLPARKADRLKNHVLECASCRALLHRLQAGHRWGAAGARRAGRPARPTGLEGPAGGCRGGARRHRPVAGIWESWLDLVTTRGAVRALAVIVAALLVLLAVTNRRSSPGGATLAGLKPGALDVRDFLPLRIGELPDDPGRMSRPRGSCATCMSTRRKRPCISSWRSRRMRCRPISSVRSCAGRKSPCRSRAASAGLRCGPLRCPDGPRLARSQSRPGHRRPEALSPISPLSPSFFRPWASVLSVPSFLKIGAMSTGMSARFAIAAQVAASRTPYRAIKASTLGRSPSPSRTRIPGQGFDRRDDRGQVDAPASGCSSRRNAFFSRRKLNWSRMPSPWASVAPKRSDRNIPAR